MLYERIPSHREEPTLYFCGRDENLKAGTRYGPVIRDAYVVECCTGGEGGVIINGKEYSVRAGDCYFLMPNDVITHLSGEGETRRGVWCTVDGLQVGRALAEVGITTESPFAPPELFEKIKEQVERMLTWKGNESIGADYHRTAIIYNILGILLESKKRSDGESLIAKAIGIMECDYPTELSVSRLAAEVGLERSYFSVLFKKHTGRSPHSYLNQLRIKKACVLMKEYDYSVSEVAEQVGLESTNFARIFKREIGKTPREYLKV
ncbi:MAG: AraC family transcriptional regulator [Clostridia bacterium]|nr:AraC family transcriptional regulator [Clostridia bacterium]